MYVVCEEHLDQAIDEFVDDYEMPPDIHLLSEITFTEWTAPQYCHYCSHAPKYLVV